MSHLQCETKRFNGNPQKVHGDLVGYLEEQKEILQTQLVNGLGFGLLAYELRPHETEIAVIKSDAAIRAVDLAEFSSIKVFQDRGSAWHKSLNLLQAWKNVHPHSIIYGWKSRHAFRFSHNLGLPVLTASGCPQNSKVVIEFLIFQSLTPGTLPFFLIDTAIGPPRSNGLCVLEAAPSENLLYTCMKETAEGDPVINSHLTRALLKAKTPSINYRILRKLKSHRVATELAEDVVNCCLRLLSRENQETEIASMAIKALRFAASGRHISKIEELIARLKGHKEGGYALRELELIALAVGNNASELESTPKTLLTESASIGSSPLPLSG